MATHTLITGLEEYVRESFVSNTFPFYSLLGLVGELLFLLPPP